MAQTIIPRVNNKVVGNTVQSLYRQGGLKNVATRHDSLIRQEGRRWGVSEALTKTAIYVESRGRETAQSGAGAYGPMQLMQGTAGDLKVDRFDPRDNIRGGIKYYGQLLSRYRGDTEKAIAAYNWGMGNVDRVANRYGTAWRAALPTETRNYLAQYRAIMNNGKQIN